MQNLAPTVATARADAADFVEVSALHADDQNASFTDLQRVMIRAATDGSGDDQEAAEEASEAVWSELDDRCRAAPEGYAFDVNAQFLQAHRLWRSSVYAFLLTLSLMGKDGAPDAEPGDRLFEQISLHAAREYFGGADLARGYHMGSPRVATPRSFGDAVDRLITELGEGSRCIRQRDDVQTAMDDGLDIVVWKPFPDGRASQLIAFGQCATGQNWSDKTKDMLPKTFTQRWFEKPPMVPPLPMFFVPYRLNNDVHQWTRTAEDAEQVVFDRCRIAHHAHRVPRELRQRCRAWTLGALRRMSS